MTDFSDFSIDYSYGSIVLRCVSCEWRHEFEESGAQLSDLVQGAYYHYWETDGSCQPA